MKLILLSITVCITSLTVSCAQDEANESLDLHRLKFLEENIEDQMYSFFHSMLKADYESVYSYGSDKFKNKIPAEWFSNKLEDWKIRDVKVLFISKTEDSGFYVMLQYIADDNGTPNLDYTVQFWKIDNGNARFLHFPFIRTGIPDTMLLTPLYKHN